MVRVSNATRLTCVASETEAFYTAIEGILLDVSAYLGSEPVQSRPRFRHSTSWAHGGQGIPGRSGGRMASKRSQSRSLLIVRDLGSIEPRPDSQAQDPKPEVDQWNAGDEDVSREPSMAETSDPLDSTERCDHGACHPA